MIRERPIREIERDISFLNKCMEKLEKELKEAEEKRKYYISKDIMCSSCGREAKVIIPEKVKLCRECYKTMDGDRKFGCHKQSPIKEK